MLRVFVGDDGRHGNQLGVVLDGAAVRPERRQPFAAELGFPETVFVDDPEHGDIRIFTPSMELPFAGHPSVGTGWMLRVDTLRPPAGDVPVRRQGDLTWIAGRQEWAPPFERVELGSPADVDALAGPPSGQDLAAMWAWEDEAAGRVRARVFAPAIGVEEDEATGAAAVRLGSQLGRDLEIHQGRGSVIHVHPREDGMVEVGGRVVVDEVRSLPN